MATSYLHDPVLKRHSLATSGNIRDRRREWGGDQTDAIELATSKTFVSCSRIIVALLLRLSISLTTEKKRRKADASEDFSFKTFAL